MIRILLYGLTSVLAAAAAVASHGQLQNLSVGLATAFLVPLIEQVVLGRTEIRLLWYSLRYRSRQVRVSYSYLYRFRLGGQYLLVQGNRFPQFQPVGGVYKTLATGSGVLAKFGAAQDDLVPIDPTSENDLRIRLRGKELYAFYKWLESGTGRETAPWREFYEELVLSGVLTAAAFPYVHHAFLGRTVRPMRYSPYAASDELLIADIYELLPTVTQLVELTALQMHGDSRIRWATEDEIRRLGAAPTSPAGLPIAEPAVWTLDVKP